MNNFLKSCCIVLSLAGMLLAGDISLIQPIVVTGAVRVTWNANQEPDLAGYNVYATNDTSAHQWKRFVDVADTTAMRFDVRDLCGVGITRMFFAVAAYDESGNLSDYSAVVDIPVQPDSVTYLFGDVDRNGRVNVIDFALFSWSFGSSTDMENFNPWLDLNCSGDINYYEHLAFTINHGAIQ